MRSASCLMGATIGLAAILAAAGGADGSALEDERLIHWREDLRALVDGIAKRHKDAFHSIARETFESAARDLEARLPALEDHQVVVGFMQLAAMIGDGHTRVRHDGARPPFRVFPVGLAWFSDGIFVVSAIDEHADLVGSELIRVGETPAEEAARRVAAALPVENEASLKHLAPRFLGIAEVVHAVGLSAAADHVAWTIRGPEGEERAISLEAMAPATARSRMSAAAGNRGAVIPGAPLPLARQTRDRANWFDFLPEEQALYVCYATCADEQGQTVSAFAAAVLEFIDARKPARVIIDLRRNGGGDSSLLQPLVKGLAKRTEVNQRGRLFVLIGRGTFSSAQMNARDLRQRTAAILCGEPTGQKPNAFGEVKTFALPHSQLEVQYSTKRFITDPADPPSMMPDVLIELSSTDFFAGRDPALEAALRHVDPAAR